MQLYLVGIQLYEYATLTYYLGSKSLDVIVGSQFLLELGQNVQSQYLLVAVCLLVMTCLYDFRELDIEGVGDVVNADVGSQSAEVDKLFWQDAVSQLTCDNRHFNLVASQLLLKLRHGLILAHFDDGTLHILQALVHLALSCYQTFCFVDSLIDFHAEG